VAGCAATLWAVRPAGLDRALLVARLRATLGRRPHFLRALFAFQPGLVQLAVEVGFRDALEAQKLARRQRARLVGAQQRRPFAPRRFLGGVLLPRCGLGVPARLVGRGALGGPRASNRLRRRSSSAAAACRCTSSISPAGGRRRGRSGAVHAPAPSGRTVLVCSGAGRATATCA